MDEKQLFKLDFSIPGSPEIRTVLMAPEVAKLVIPPWPNSIMGERCARLRADLESFLSGDPITVCWEPFKGKQYHKLGRLHPVHDGVWDMRSIDPSPGLRVLFFLAEKDVMIALRCCPRSIPVPWLHRALLGAWDSGEWRKAINECKAEWIRLFPNCRPLVRSTIDECLSNAVPL